MPPAPFTYGTLTLDRHTRNEAAVLGARSFYDDPFFIHLSAEPMLRARGLALYMRSHLAALGDTAVATGARDRAGNLVGICVWQRPGTYPLPVTAQIGAQQGQFLAQRPHLRRPVQSQQVSPLPSRRVPQLLDGADPRQRHQRQQHEHATQPIEAFGQRIEFRAVAQQSHRQQRWQRQQHATSRNIPGRLEDNGRRFQLAHRCRHSLQRPGCAVAHRRGAVDLTAFALVRGPVRGRDQFFLNS